MQWKNGFPNLYATKKMVPTMTGQKSWNCLETVKKHPKYLENKTILVILSSQVKIYMKQKKKKIEKVLHFQNL